MPSGLVLLIFPASPSTPLPHLSHAAHAMLDTFTIETFTPRLGEIFRVVVDEKWEMQTRLTAVERLGGGDDRARTPFSLVFHAAPEAVVPQQIYRVENENMEPFELFLVPIQPDPQGMRYQAIFT